MATPCLNGGCALDCSCTVCQGQSGNPVSGIPVKVGSPLSSACERATLIGSIPEIVRFVNFTMVSGAPAINAIPMGGICNIPSFFKSRNGCFYNSNSRLSGATCC